jgi:hypothetical protein
MRHIPITSTVLLLLTGCGVDLSYDPHLDIHRGEDARDDLHHCDREKLPKSATDFWVFNGGNFNGSIYYASFRCATLDDCWAAVKAFRGPDKDKFQPGLDTKFAVNKWGPKFYHPQLQTDKLDWNIAEITNGTFYEEADGNRFMDFWAIDFDNLRVYFHHESGGFPDDPPSVKSR